MKTSEPKITVDAECRKETKADVPLYLTAKFCTFLAAAAKTFGIAEEKDILRNPLENEMHR